METALALLPVVLPAPAIPDRVPKDFEKPASVLRWAGLLFLCGAVLLLGGCAAEAPPRPPRVEQPEKVNNLTVTQIGRTLRLRFTAPVRAMDGRTLTKPLGVDFFRQAAPPGQQKTFIAVKPWVSIPAQDLSRYKHGTEIVYEDELSPQGFARLAGETLAFSVMTFTRAFRGRLRISDPSNIARTQLIDVSPPIQNVRTRQIPHAVEVEWSAPVRSLTGAPLPPVVKYRIYRAQKPHSGSFNQVGETASPPYRDTKFEYNQTYVYKVRAAFAQNGHTAQTADSLPASITPRGIFPPQPPQGLTAVYTGQAIQLVWKPSVASRVAGYNVYREQSGRTVQRMNPELLRTPVFTDSSIAHGGRYTYWVTAVDKVGNESLRSQTATAEAR
ncbi:MAG TPA: hypothetical protein VFZ08_14395 [Terriglobia bacterium]|nr:hypothetical protein [Terriglobia bacterium]